MLHLKLLGLGLGMALLVILFADFAKAGGPVITPEEVPEKLRDGRTEGAWIVPVIIGLVIIGAALGGEDDAGPVCNGDTPTDPC